MGIFDVSMSALYGEREQAFIRLQEHIIQHSADESVFAWDLDRNSHPEGYSGLLAASPSSFRRSGHIISYGESRSFGFANLGLSISWPTLPYSLYTYLALIECYDRADNRRCAILLRRLSGKDQYVRVMDVDGQSLLKKRRSIRLNKAVVERQIYVPQKPTETLPDLVYGFWLRSVDFPDTAFRRTTLLSRAQIPAAGHMLLESAQTGLAGIVSIEPVGSQHQGWTDELRWIGFGFDPDFNILVALANGATSPGSFDEAVKAGPDSVAHKSFFADNEWLAKAPLWKDVKSSC